MTDALYASIFVEMQCTGNSITANRVVQTGANPYQTCAAIHVDSYLNTVVANDFGSSGMCVSGLPQGSVYGPLKYRTAARTLFLRLYLAHFCSLFRRFFAALSVLTPGFQNVALEDRGPVA